MPTRTLKTQNGNSCAVHCAVVAAAELGDAANFSESYAEQTIWPQVIFRAQTGNLATALLQAAKNSDPCLLLEQTISRYPSLTATLLCSDLDCGQGLQYVPPPQDSFFDTLYTLIKAYKVPPAPVRGGPIALQDGAFYNASYVMMQGSDVKTATFSGLHNMLITRQNAAIWHYNSNEKTPAWNKVNDWKILNNQNQGNYCYVFTGVCIEMKK